MPTYEEKKHMKKAGETLAEIMARGELCSDPIDKIVELILAEARRRRGTDVATRIASVQIDVSERLTEAIIVTHSLSRPV